MSDVSGILLAVLAMAALLGALIGGAVTLWFAQRHARQLEAQVDQARSASDREAAERLAVSQQTLERERKAHSDLVTVMRSKERDAEARHDALQVHARTQTRQLEALQGEQLASEERQVRLERALHAQREELGWTVRDRSSVAGDKVVQDASDALEPSARSANDSSSGSGGEALLPLLQKRHVTGSSGSGRPPRTLRSRLASGRLARGTGGAQSAVRPLDEGEFPALSEADLPDSVDGLELDGPGETPA